MFRLKNTALRGSETGESGSNSCGDDDDEVELAWSAPPAVLPALAELPAEAEPPPRTDEAYFAFTEHPWVAVQHAQRLLRYLSQLVEECQVCVCGVGGVPPSLQVVQGSGGGGERDPAGSVDRWGLPHAQLHCRDGGLLAPLQERQQPPCAPTAASHRPAAPVPPASPALQHQRMPHPPAHASSWQGFDISVLVQLPAQQVGGPASMPDDASVGCAGLVAPTAVLVQLPAQQVGGGQQSAAES